MPVTVMPWGDAIAAWVFNYFLSYFWNLNTQHSDGIPAIYTIRWKGKHPLMAVADFFAKRGVATAGCWRSGTISINTHKLCSIEAISPAILCYLALTIPVTREPTLSTFNASLMVVSD